jgi:hypothetical protein
LLIGSGVELGLRLIEPVAGTIHFIRSFHWVILLRDAEVIRMR